MIKKTYRPKAKLEIFYSGGPIQISPDGATIACACLQETKIVDALNGSVVKTLPGDGEWVTALCFTPDGLHLYTASRSFIMKKWRLQSSECVKSIRDHAAPVSDICIDPSGSVVAFGSADRNITIYDIQGSFRTHTLKGHKSTVTRVRFHPSEAELLSCSADSTIKVWDLRQSKLKATLKGHNSAVSTVSYTEDGKYFVSAGRDNIVIVWSGRTYAKCVEFPVFESLEDIVVLSSVIGDQLLPNTAKKSRYPRILLACGGERGALRLWKTDTGSDVLSKTADGSDKAPVHEIISVQRIADSTKLLLVKSDCSIEFVNLKANGGNIVAETGRFLLGNMDEITDIAFVTSQGKQVAVASNSAYIQVLDTQSMNCVSMLCGHSDAVLCIASSSFKSKPILLTGSKDQSIRVWDASNWKCLADGTGHAAAVTALAVSKRDSKLVVSVSADKIVKLWKLKMQTTGEDTLVVEKLKVTSGIVAHAKEINCVDISPNDAWIATGSMDKSIKVLNVPSLIVQTTLQGHKRGVWSVQFSTSDKTLLSSSADTTIKLWSLTDSTCLRTFEGHSGSILKALFLSHSRQVLSCGGDGLLKLWNVATCECMGTFDEHEDRIWSIAFAGERQEILASGGSDSALIIWEDTTERDKQEEIRQKQEELNKQQNLSNAIQLRDYRLAASLAFELAYPQKLLVLLKKNLPKSEHVHIFEAIVDLLLDDESMKRCLEYIRDWNTNSKHCEEAQSLLRMIFERYSPQRIAAIPGIAAVLEGIESYTVRHFGRLQKIHQATYLVDYLLESMHVLTPDAENEQQQKHSEPVEMDCHPSVNET